MKKIIVLLLSSLALFSCSQKEKRTADYNVIPLPQSVELKEGEGFKMNANTKIVYPSGNDKLKKVAELFVEYVDISCGLKISATTQNLTDNAVVLSVEAKSDNQEAYTIETRKELISIKGASEAGVFYGLQTLRKSIRLIDSCMSVSEIEFPSVIINDYPRFAYRGIMLDVGRHFFPIDYIKKHIDILAMHNINKFHWHLTDDQGWRIEIKKYPKLTEIGAFRKETVIGRNSSVSDGKSYGGFYTQDEIKEIVAYAQDRFITIIPEIDLPGHMQAALTSYPELGCTGGPYEVAKSWGVFDEVLCVGNENTFAFLEGVFSELIELFPSEYIHIGGDECPKTRWKECPKCQAKIKELGIKTDKAHNAEEKLQSYCIARMEKFLNSKGRKIIGWDEILEGGLAPNATVMSWRSVDGGIQAAKEGHDAIMTPTSHLYFDYYQTQNIDTEPLAIGGFVPIEKVYSFDPIPTDLPEEAKKHIIGVQANEWTEYITTSQQVEYMLLPRIAALSEVQWTMPEKKDYNEFMTRLFPMTKLYDQLDLNYCKAIFDVNSDIKFEEGKIVVNFSTIDKCPIYYTLDGSEPNDKSLLYSEAIKIDKNTVLKAVANRKGKYSRIFTDSFDFNKATLKPITVSITPHRNYLFGGEKMLLDGRKGGGSYRDGTWLGYYGKDFEAVIDLEQLSEVSSVEVNTFVSIGDWVFGATRLNIAISDDNKNYKEVFNKEYPVLEATQGAGIINLSAQFDKRNTRYVKVLIGVTKSMPEWHAGKGQPSFLFLDEIMIK